MAERYKSPTSMRRRGDNYSGYSALGAADAAPPCSSFACWFRYMFLPAPEIAAVLVVDSAVYP